MVKVSDYLVCVYTSQHFAQTQQNFVPSHDGETVTFRSSGKRIEKLLIIIYPRLYMKIRRVRKSLVLHMFV